MVYSHDSFIANSKTFSIVITIINSKTFNHRPLTDAERNEIIKMIEDKLK